MLLLPHGALPTLRGMSRGTEDKAYYIDGDDEEGVRIKCRTRSIICNIVPSTVLINPKGEGTLLYKRARPLYIKAIT